MLLKDSHLDQKYILRYQPKTNMYLNISLIHKFLTAPSNASASKLAHSSLSIWRPLKVQLLTRGQSSGEDPREDVEN